MSLSATPRTDLRDRVARHVVAVDDVYRAARVIRKHVRVVQSDACSHGHHLYKKGKGSPYSITERRIPELIPVLGSQPAGDVAHKPGARLPLGLLSARPAVTPRNP